MVDWWNFREKKRDQVGWKNTQHALPVIFPAVRWRSDFVWGGRGERLRTNFSLVGGLEHEFYFSIY